MSRPFLVAAVVLLVAACSTGSDTTDVRATTSVPIDTTTPPATNQTVAPDTVPVATTTSSAADSDAIVAPAVIAVETVVAELDAATGGIAVDSDGVIYVADIGPAPARNGTRIYRIEVDGSVGLLVDDERLRGASGNAIGPDGVLYQASLGTGAVYAVEPDGTVRTVADQGLRRPVGIAVDPDGVLYVADCGGLEIVRIDKDGVAETYARSSLFTCPNGITLGNDGSIYVANFSNGKILRVDTAGEVTELVTLPGANNGHLVYLDGLLYVAGRGANQVFVVTLDGRFDVYAGAGERGSDDGSANEATFSLPNGIAIGPDGSLLINQVTATEGSANHPTAIRRIVTEPLEPR
jgi:sugar lactone lactonase YvrE